MLKLDEANANLCFIFETNNQITIITHCRYLRVENFG